MKYIISRAEDTFPLSSVASLPSHRLRFHGLCRLLALQVIVKMGQVLVILLSWQQVTYIYQSFDEIGSDNALLVILFLLLFSLLFQEGKPYQIEQFLELLLHYYSQESLQPALLE